MVSIRRTRSSSTRRPSQPLTALLAGVVVGAISHRLLAVSTSSSQAGVQSKLRQHTICSLALPLRSHTSAPRHVRHVAMQLFWAEIAYWSQHHSYTASISTLMQPAYCSYSPPQNVSNYCRPDDLGRALSFPNVFSVKVEVDLQSKKCVQYPTPTVHAHASGGPCFFVQV